MTHLNKKKMAGLLLCLGAVAVVAVGWAYARSNLDVHRQRLYSRRRDLARARRSGATSRPWRSRTTRPFRAGDVLFRIDDRDYRARLAQAVANVEAAQARLANVDAETELSMRSSGRPKPSSARERRRDEFWPHKASDRRRELIRTDAVSQAQVDESDAARSRAEAGVSGGVRNGRGAAATHRRACHLSAKPPLPPSPRPRPRAISPRSISTTPWYVRRSMASSATARSASAGSSRRAPRCSISFRSRTSGSSRTSRRPRSSIFDPVSASASPSTAFPHRTLEGVVDSFAPGSGSAFSPSSRRQCDRQLRSRRPARAGEDPVRRRIRCPVASCPACRRVSRSMAAAAHDHDCRRRGGLATACRRNRAPLAGIVLATLTEAIASTVLSLGRGDIIGDTHATPDEFAWLDVGYTDVEAHRVHDRAPG